jgi:uncharacterized protein YjbI with pentapeptide repeats
VATDLPQPPETAEESEEQSSRVQLWLIVLAVLVLGGVVEVIIYGYVERPGWIGSSGKQFWDYLDLLIVPAALALGVYWLNRRQNERDQQAEDAQQERALAVESQRAQDEALQAYLDQMAQLLIEHPLRRASPGDALSTVARARTLTVLGRLGSSQKRSVLQFLHESRLIERRNIISLAQADLRGADLRGADLSRADLSRADLSGAILSGAILTGAYLSRADLREAILYRAILREADLGWANLSGTDLGGAYLSRADLSRAVLRGADLSAALELTYMQIAAAYSLEGATMPDGQKYEDWLKDKEGREEEGENTALRN